MDDIRDKFPMPPCVMCGAGMCVKNEKGEGYRCPKCGQRYEFEISGRPMTDPRLSSLRPLALYLRLTLGHWRTGIEHAMETLQYERMIEAIETHKKWLDEVMLPMADHVGEVRRGEEPELLAETDDSDWLGAGWWEKIR